MNERQRMQAFREAVTYGEVMADYRPDDVTRLMVIHYESRRYNVCLHLGQVFALTIDG